MISRRTFLTGTAACAIARPTLARTPAPLSLGGAPIVFDSAAIDPFVLLNTKYVELLAKMTADYYGDPLPLTSVF